MKPYELLELRKKISQKNKIPETRISSLFSKKITPHSTAISWARGELKTKLSQKALEGIKNKINKQYHEKGLLIIDARTEESFVCAIEIGDQERMDTLTYESIYDSFRRVEGNFERWITRENFFTERTV